MAAVLNNFMNSFTNRLEAPVRQHLKNVYACLAISTLAAAAGAYVHLYTDVLQDNLLPSLGTLVLCFALGTTPDNGKNTKLRFIYLLGFAFLSGLGVGPLLQLVISINPTILVTALIGTAAVFVSFTISSLFAARGCYLYLGGILCSLLNIMVLFSLINLVLRWSLFHQIHIYVGLFLMCGFVMYDTQFIIAKFQMGSKDFILHSLDLFIDFIGIFRYLIVILTQKELAKERRKRKD